MKQTAVEWLQEKISYTTTNGNIITYHKDMTKVFEQAKEMEKEQIMDAIKFTIQDEFTKQTWKYGKCCHDTAVNYYKQTFKSE